MIIDHNVIKINKLVQSLPTFNYVEALTMYIITNVHNASTFKRSNWCKAGKIHKTLRNRNVCLQAEIGCIVKRAISALVYLEQGLRSVPAKLYYATYSVYFNAVIIITLRFLIYTNHIPGFMLLKFNRS